MAKRYRIAHLGPPGRIKGWNSLGRRLRLRTMGVTIAQFPSGKAGEYSHPHSHGEQEEVYVLLGGRGEMIVDGKLLRLKPGDVVAVDPSARRGLRSATGSASTWLMVGAAAGRYSRDDWVEYDEPAFPSREPRKPPARRPARSRRGERRESSG